MKFSTTKTNHSLSSLLLVAVLATAAGMFVIHKSEIAITEIGAINEKPYAILRKSVEDNVVDTSNWKIYRNEKYAFEVKYPLNLTVDVNLDPCCGIAAEAVFSFADVSFAQKPSKFTTLPPEFYITIYKNNFDIRDDDEIIYTDLSNCQGEPSFRVNAAVGTGNYPAREINLVGTHDVCSATYFFSLSHGNYIYNIRPAVEGPQLGKIDTYDPKERVSKTFPGFRFNLESFQFIR